MVFFWEKIVLTNSVCHTLELIHHTKNYLFPTNKGIKFFKRGITRYSSDIITFIFILLLIKIFLTFSLLKLIEIFAK